MPEDRILIWTEIILITLIKTLYSPFINIIDFYWVKYCGLLYCYWWYPVHLIFNYSPSPVKLPAFLPQGLQSSFQLPTFNSIVWIISPIVLICALITIILCIFMFHVWISFCIYIFSDWLNLAWYPTFK